MEIFFIFSERGGGGGDTGCLEGVFKPIKRGSFSPFYGIFKKFLNEMEIIWTFIWSQTGVQANHRNPFY